MSLDMLPPVTLQPGDGVRDAEGIERHRPHQTTFLESFLLATDGDEGSFSPPKPSALAGQRSSFSGALSQEH
jgi:hypothetical protein